MSKFFKWLFRDRFAEQVERDVIAPNMPKPSRPLHPRLAQMINEGWMAPAVSPSGKPLILNGVTYYEYIRNAEKLTYSRNLAYEAAVTEYHEIAGHSSLLKHQLKATRELASEIFNYRNTDPARSELAMQQLIGLSTATEKALETKHPMGFICQVAAIFFVAENEDPDINDAALQEEKTAVFLKAYEFHDFFTNAARPLERIGSALRVEFDAFYSAGVPPNSSAGETNVFGFRVRFDRERTEQYLQTFAGDVAKYNAFIRTPVYEAFKHLDYIRKDNERRIEEAQAQAKAVRGKV